MTQPNETMRVDKWLWHARFFKTRGLCAKMIASGKMRINGARIRKASTSVKPKDVLTFVQAKNVRVIQIEKFGDRRGPATEAQALYQDLSPIEEKPEYIPAAPKFDGKGRPNSQQRRRVSSFSAKSLE